MYVNLDFVTNYNFKKWLSEHTVDKEICMQG